MTGLALTTIDKRDTVNGQAVDMTGLCADMTELCADMTGIELRTKPA